MVSLSYPASIIRWDLTRCEALTGFGTGWELVSQIINRGVLSALTCWKGHASKHSFNKYLFAFHCVAGTVQWEWYPGQRVVMAWWGVGLWKGNAWPGDGWSTQAEGVWWGLGGTWANMWWEKRLGRLGRSFGFVFFLREFSSVSVSIWFIRSMVTLTNTSVLLSSLISLICLMFSVVTSGTEWWWPVTLLIVHFLKVGGGLPRQNEPNARARCMILLSNLDYFLVGIRH